MSSQHILVYWEEEGLTSIVKSSQVVEPSNPLKGAKAQITWGQKILPVTIIETGCHRELKQKEAEFHKPCDEKLEHYEESGPAKKKPRKEKTDKEGKKKVNILCITKPPEHVPPSICNSTDQTGLTLNQLFEELKLLRHTFEGIESWVREELAVFQVTQELQAAKICELQTALEKQEHTWSLGSRQDESTGLQMSYRKPFCDVTNLPPTTAQFSSTPVRAIQKSAADVIGENIR